MSEPVVTEADRERARQVVEQVTSRTMYVSRDAERGWVDAIATALAAERAEARAPFMALADRWERAAQRMTLLDARKMTAAASDIRRAAEETE